MFILRSGAASSPVVVLRGNIQEIEPFTKLRFSFKIKACEKFYHRHIIDIPRIKF